MGYPERKAWNAVLTLAQKLDRPLSRPPVDLSASIAARAPLDLGQLARRISAVPQASVVASLPLPPLRVPSDTALDLLGEVAAALTTLMGRCKTLESALAAAKDEARAEIETARDVAREWQEVASTLKAKVDDADRTLAAMRSRAEAAERELAETQATADRSQQAAAEAECLSSLFQEKVIASFGIGSAGHSILENVRNHT